MATIPGGRRLVVGLVMAVTMGAFETVSVVTAMPTITAELHGDALYGAAFSAYLLANLVAIVASGEIADRHGPMAPFLAGLAGFAAGLVVAGTAPSMLVVVAGRVLQGAGAGTLYSISYVAVGRGFPPALHGKVFAAMSSAWVIPSLIGPAAAGFIVEHAGWRWVFLALVPLLPVLLLLAGPPLRDLTAPHPPAGHLPLADPPTAITAADAPTAAPSRIPAAVVLAVGVGLLVTGLSSSRVHVLVPLVVGGAVLAWAPVHRLLPPGTFRGRAGLPAAVASRGLINVAFLGVDAFIPFAATRIHGAGPLAAGMLVVGGSLTWTVGSVVQARRGERWSPGPVVAIGFLIVAIGLASSMIVVVRSIAYGLTFLTWSVAGFGIGAIFNTTSITALEHTAPGNEGLTSSQLQVADALGFALAGGINGAIVGIAERGGHDLAGALVVVFLLAVAACGLGTLAGRNVRHGPGAAAPPPRAAAP